MDYDERVLPSITSEVLKAVVAQFDAGELITQREVGFGKFESITYINFACIIIQTITLHYSLDRQGTLLLTLISSVFKSSRKSLGI